MALELGKCILIDNLQINALNGQTWNSQIFGDQVDQELIEINLKRLT